MTRRVFKPLVSRGELLHYWENSDGVCNGLVLKWIEACLLGQEEVFNQRVSEILSGGSTDFVPRIEASKRAVQTKDRSLPDSEEDISNRERLRILGLYEGIELYQSPHLHKDVFQKSLVQDDFEEVSKIAGSDQILELGGLARIYSDINLFEGKTRQEVCSKTKTYLEGLVALLPEDAEHPEVTFHLACENHAIGIMYNTRTKVWRFLDPNAFQDTVGSKELTIDTLVEEMYDGFKQMYPSQSELNLFLDFVQHKANESPTKEFKSQLPLTAENGLPMYVSVSQKDGKWIWKYCMSDAGMLDGRSEMERGKVFNEIFHAYNVTKKSNVPLTFCTSIVTTQAYKPQFDLARLEAYKMMRKDMGLKGRLNDIKNRDSYIKNAKNLATLAIHHNDVSLMREVHEQLTTRDKPVLIYDLFLSDTRKIIHKAASYGRDEIIRFLIELKRDSIAEPDGQGFVPLHIAVRSGHINVCRTLVHERPDMLMALDCQGKTPVHYALEDNNRELVSLFSQYAKRLFIDALISGDGRTIDLLLDLKKSGLTLEYDKEIYKKSDIVELIDDSKKDLFYRSGKIMSLREIAQVIAPSLADKIPRVSIFTYKSRLPKKPTEPDAMDDNPTSGPSKL